MSHLEIESLIDAYGPASIIEKLAPMLTDKRKLRIESMLKNRLKSIHVAVESPFDVHNALAIVRSAEAFGVNHIHIIDQVLKRNKGRGTVQGASRWTHLGIYRTLDDFLVNFDHHQMTLAAACVDGNLLLNQVPVDKPICLFFGNELLGLSEAAKRASKITYQIPMYGMVESLNLSVSAAISLYEIAKRRRQYLSSVSDLTENEFHQEHAWATIRAIGFERAKSILHSRSI